MGELEALALYPRRKGSALFNYRDSCVMSKAVREMFEGLRDGGSAEGRAGAANCMAGDDCHAYQPPTAKGASIKPGPPSLKPSERR